MKGGKQDECRSGRSGGRGGGSPLTCRPLSRSLASPSLPSPTPPPPLHPTPTRPTSSSHINSVLPFVKKIYPLFKQDFLFFGRVMFLLKGEDFHWKCIVVDFDICSSQHLLKCKALFTTHRCLLSRCLCLAYPLYSDGLAGEERHRLCRVG